MSKIIITRLDLNRSRDRSSMRKPISHEAHFKRQKRVLLFLLVVVHPLDNHVDNLEKSVKVVVIVKNKLHGIHGGRVDVLSDKNDIEKVNMVKKNKHSCSNAFDFSNFRTHNNFAEK